MIFPLVYVKNIQDMTSILNFIDGQNLMINKAGFPCFKTEKKTWAEVVLHGIPLHEYYDNQRKPPVGPKVGVIDRHRNGRAKKEWNCVSNEQAKYEPRRSRFADEYRRSEIELEYDFWDQEVVEWPLKRRYNPAHYVDPDYIWDGIDWSGFFDKYGGGAFPVEIYFYIPDDM